ncbi:L,D-transpeptidase family protein [Plasticicumulans acidivorans]|uniref:L,D-transpeptidase ErfK/SrfK n=1 Tax=Plasticicumulans acidivorans TaxID=886464 RepID=A0A317MYH4_9GAMM|nr:L,D-transpeptidase family protein [Plasticicumulans acidivorans]PWV64388.1 L,D-transpeptidase ErfK/SrfK [Plasticicumulans acidivorans]
MVFSTVSRRCWFGALLLAASGHAAAVDTYPLPPSGTDLVGEIRIEYARQEDTFLDIARRNGLGYDEIVAANPGVDRWLPGEGTPVILPLEHILPDAPHEGIVVNVPEMRLYYYPGGEGVVKTFAISIGRMDWHSPLGTTRIVAKQVNPTWTPPASIKAEHLAKGDPLPDVVPGGPDNPLGTRAMRLGIPGYLIHGTNNPNGIGMRVTHGCIRMYPEDIERLFPEVPVSTKVTLVNQLAKLGWKDGRLYLEYHSPLEEDEIPTDKQISDTVTMIHSRLPNVQLSAPDIVETVVRQASGMPVAITP